MKFEKRSDAAPETTETAPKAAPETAPSKKPVIIYIMIMFIVAFLLMAMSFIMHQRSNTEALGQLQNSVNAMQTVQANQEQIIDLQAQLAQAQDHIDKLGDDVEDLREMLLESDDINAALTNLYALQQQYASGNFASCKEIIAQMEAKEMPQLLSKESVNGATSPFDRYGQLRDAVLAK